MAKKKSHNPFKMWGSYAGAIFSILLFPLIDYGSGTTMIELFSDLTFIQIIILAPIGFLIGYGIHSLIRAIRK